MSHPFEDWSKLNEGWDGGDIAVDEMIENAKTVFGNSLGAILIALGGLWVIKLLFSIFVGVLFMGAAWVTESLYGVFNILIWLGIPIAIAISFVQFSLFRPMQLQAFEGKEFVSGLGDVFRLASGVVVKVGVTLLLYGVSLCLGAILCGIGSLFAAFFFCQAPYLAATTELGPMDCMKRSYELNKAYALPVIIALALSFVATGIFTGCGSSVVAVIGGLLNQALPPIQPLVTGVFNDVLGFLSAAVSLMITGSLFTTIQSVERGVPFKR